MTFLITLTPHYSHTFTHIEATNKEMRSEILKDKVYKPNIPDALRFIYLNLDTTLTLAGVWLAGRKGAIRPPTPPSPRGVEGTHISTCTLRFWSWTSAPRRSSLCSQSYRQNVTSTSACSLQTQVRKLPLRCQVNTLNSSSPTSAPSGA